MPSSASTIFDKVLLWDGSDNLEADYTDNTIEAQSIGGTAFSLLQNQTQRVLFGSSEKFDGILFDVAVAGGYAGITWEYYNGSTWERIVPLSASYIHDVDVTPTYYTFAADGMEEFP